MKKILIALTPSIGLGVLLLVIAFIIAPGCEKEKRSCPEATHTIDECVDCLNDKGGCMGSDWYFAQDTECRCE